MGIHNGAKIAVKSGAGLVDLLGQQPGSAHIAGGASKLGCCCVDFIDRREQGRWCGVRVERLLGNGP